MRAKTHERRAKIRWLKNFDLDWLVPPAGANVIRPREG